MYIDDAQLPPEIILQPFLSLPVAAIWLNAGPITKIVVPICHRHKTWKNRVQVGKHQSYSLSLALSTDF